MSNPLTVRNFLAQALAAAEQRGYQRAVAELQSCVADIVGGRGADAPPASTEEQPTTDLRSPEHRAAVERRQAVAPAPNGNLSPLRRRILDFVRNNPGATAADAKRRGFKSMGVFYLLAHDGKLRVEPRTTDRPFTRFYPIEAPSA